ncbi:hypothetical protein A7982_12412 [Minicystis rosea]|nr:hypothetical protein A7982_12412 [Minicystis rosea]
MVHADAPRTSALPQVGADRRRRRSDDPITALHYQLAHTRAEGGLDAVVLVDDAGCLVAGAGAWPACEELAAYAPLLANRAAIGSAAVGSRIAALESEVLVQTLTVDGCEIVVCGRGGDGSRQDLLARAAAGCRRILAG